MGKTAVLMRNMARLAAIASMASWWACATPASGASRPGDLQVIVSIDADTAPKPYSPMIFGGFVEHFHRVVYGGLFEPGSPLADERGFRKDVIAALRELKLSVVRWPGGCFASGYHWMEGVGPTRNPVPDPAWGVTDPNTFGTDEFVEWCRLVGCEPYICTNAGSGTPEEMRRWLEYCNCTQGEFAALRKANGHADPFSVRYWSIGNENYGAHEIGVKSASEWSAYVNESARLMRSVDPRIALAAAATPDRAWSLPLLESTGDQLDCLAVHNYWLGLWAQNDMPDYLTCIMKSDGPEETIAAMVAVLDESGRRGRTRIAFDEWNLRSWHHPGFPRKEPVDPADPVAADLIARRDAADLPEQYTMADALFCASFLNACLRHSEDVAMANIAPIVNTRGPLYVHPAGIVKRTTFHTLFMYANLLESRVAPTTVEAGRISRGDESIGVSDAIATVDESGTSWAIALANRHPSSEIACTVKLGATVLSGTFTATILSGDSPDAYNDTERPDRVSPERTTLRFDRGVTSLPPHSLTVVQLSLDASERNP